MILQYRKQRGLFVPRSIAVLSLVNMFLALAVAAVSSIWALYINSFVGSDAGTGFVSGLLTFVSFASYFAFVPLIRKSKKSSLFFYSLFLVVITYALFWFNRSFIIFLLIAFFITAVYTVRSTVFGIIVRNKSKGDEITKNEGFVYTFANLGWVVGPLIGGYLASVYNDELVFVFAALSSFIALLIFKFSKVKDGHSEKKIEGNIAVNFIDFFRNKERLVAYSIRGGTFVWWVLVYVFMPLFIVQSGLDKMWVGYFLFGVSVPLIFTEYLFSNMTTRHGFRKMFSFGFAWAAIFGILSFFASNVFLIMALIILAGFGIAMLEPTSEAYFFKVTNQKDIGKFFGPFNTGVDVAQFAGKILASLLLLLLPFRYLFPLFSVFMLLMLAVVLVFVRNGTDTKF